MWLCWPAFLTIWLFLCSVSAAAAKLGLKAAFLVPCVCEVKKLFDLSSISYFVSDSVSTFVWLLKGLLL